MSTPQIPEGMVEVSQSEFYARLKAHRRDGMPNNANPEFTTWEDQQTRWVWGWSYPGWRNPGEPQIYAVRRGAGGRA